MTGLTTSTIPVGFESIFINATETSLNAGADDDASVDIMNVTMKNSASRRQLLETIANLAGGDEWANERLQRLLVSSGGIDVSFTCMKRIGATSPSEAFKAVVSVSQIKEGFIFMGKRTTHIFLQTVEIAQKCHCCMGADLAHCHIHTELLRSTLASAVNNGSLIEAVRAASHGSLNTSVQLDTTAFEKPEEYYASACTGTYTDDIAANNFYSDCSAATSDGNMCILTPEKGYTGGSLTCDTKRPRGALSTKVPHFFGIVRIYFLILFDSC